MFIQEIKTTAFAITLILSLSAQQSFAAESVQTPVDNTEASSGDPEEDISSQACKILGLCSSPS